MIDAVWEMLAQSLDTGLVALIVAVGEIERILDPPVDSVRPPADRRG